MINDIVNTGFPTKPPAPSNGAAALVVTAPSDSAPAATSKPAQKEKPSTEQLRSAVSKLNDYVQNTQRTLSFSIDEGTGATVVKVIDTETQELIRQIPSEDMLALAADIDKQTANLFVKEQA